MLLLHVGLLLLSGVALTVVLLRETSWIERVAYSLFFGLTTIPFLTLMLVLVTGRFLEQWMVTAVGGGLLALLAWPLWRRIRKTSWARPGWQDALVLGVASGLVAFGHVFYNKSFLHLSLTRFMQTRAADCFHRQAFRFIRELNPEHASFPLDVFYAIPSAPGNSIFTAASMQIFGVGTFHVLFALFNALIFLFAFLLLKKLTGQLWVALAVALFAVLNPYSLHIEVLDRNTIAYALSGVLLYTVWTRRDLPFLHGLIFGVTAGTGLRMLPLTLALPVLLLYALNRASWRHYPLFLLGGALTWAFNIPHLMHHGLHSLNPRAGLLESIFIAITELPRTPFLPYPNFVFYFLKSFHALGLVGAALVVAGAYFLARKDWKLLLALVLVMLPTYLVLAAQLDWVEGDKPRILLAVWMPLMLMMGAGVAGLLPKGRWRTNLAVLAGATALAALTHLGLSQVHGRVFEQTYALGKIYQRESPALAQYLRRDFSRMPLLPDYQQLLFKLDLGRKRAEEAIVAHTLYASHQPGDMPLNDWIASSVSPETIQAPEARVMSEELVTLRIDPEKLLAADGGAVTRVAGQGPVDIDLGKPGELADLYYAARQVSWQERELTIAIRPGSREVRSLGELYIELNGDQDYGDGRISTRCLQGMVKLPPGGGTWPSKRLTPYALPCTLQTTQASLLPTERSRLITVRVPRDMRLVFRYMVVTGFVGDVARVSGWTVDASEETPRLRFHFGEPEGYL